ncbi:MAG: hypothetical protein J3R72DRAFT_500132, partial [Linnemannia gamsii]
TLLLICILFFFPHPVSSLFFLTHSFSLSLQSQQLSRHHQSDMPTLPTEVLQAFTQHFSHHDLTVCVRVCQDWHAVFNPSLWERVLLDASDSTGTRFESFKRSVETGSLARNGHWIRVVHADNYDVASLLSTYGSTTCTDIATLNLGSKSVVAVDNDHIIRLLKQSPQLQGLQLSGQMMASRNPKTAQLIDAIPVKLELLFLTAWDADLPPSTYRDTHSQAARESGRGDPYYQSADKGRWYPPQPLIPFLPRLKVLGIFKFVMDNWTWPLVLRKCPNLTTLSLDLIRNLKFARNIATCARRHCPRLNCCYLYLYVDNMSKQDGVWAAFLKASTYGWEKITITVGCVETFKIGPQSMTELLRHTSTLKVLNMGYGTEISTEYIRQLYEAAPQLTVIVGDEPVDRATILGN